MYEISGNNNKTPLLGMTLAELTQVALDNGLPRFAGRQIAEWIYRRGATEIDQITNLSKQAREKLSQNYCIGRQAPLGWQKSTDGTVKYLFPGAGGRNVEAVFIPDRDRATLCISSQAGCRMGCTFCMTGRQGFHGNLTACQIINQVLSVEDSDKLTNIVFMGMGEPMDNLNAVLTTIEILTEPWGLAWSPKRITVSSIGKLKELKTLIEQTKVHIAISVHSPFADERKRLMPVEAAFPLQSIIQLLRDYDFAHQRRLSVEYILWRGLNDDFRHADALARLLKGTSARVNLIRYHRLPDSNLYPSAMPVAEAFRDRLNQAGIVATIRASRGEDIMAACGMLAGKESEKSTDN